ncbi:MAG TPA: ABC transporter ATP-binding protein, partial [Cytophagaceae bacterium]|nr:ABC transporter ATP-binding protein [Cytophagaceae bacterium]
MKPILEIQNISKKFKIQHETQRYLSIRDSISNVFTKTKNNNEDFWALKDVSFDVYPGDSIGIIGKNGAGKSTLLKILSKITPPTSGKIISRGRLASLLEVGTGFHPELTGRENIYLNGSILGLRKSEITKQFDEIVNFSGVEKFLDTPLKHYSSGMQLRLAFAVAAHLEPEILIIDEVLAVGDAEFQKKCIGKMNEVSKSGRTILFVSHNMSAVKSLCEKCIIIELGHLKLQADTSTAFNYFTSEILKTDKIRQAEVFIAPELNKSSLIKFSKIALYNSKRELQSDYSFEEEIKVE